MDNQKTDVESTIGRNYTEFRKMISKMKKAPIIGTFLL